MSARIFVLPAFGQGHFLPSMELCKHLASRNFKITLLIFSNLYSSIPSSFLQHENIEITQIPSPPPPEPGSDLRNRMQNDRNQIYLALENLLSITQPICAVVDVLLMMKWTAKTFQKFKVPTIAFFTQGACSTAMEYATWKAQVQDSRPGEVRFLPGLPDEMALSFSELKRRPGPSGGFGPPRPGERPSWVDDVESSIGVMINTCNDLERPFINYVANEIGKPVWGVGPLLPEKYWMSTGSVIQDGESRSNRSSNVSEEELIKWLDSKEPGSVLYVSFGSELSPTMDEFPHLADALEESTRPFIWVILPGSGRRGPPRAHVGSEQEEEGYFPHGLDRRVGDRGLIIKGWAPQLLILSHPSTGGFLSHCGWNSTVEAIGRGVPFLAWPIRGDQYYDAKLIVSHHKVGYMVFDDMSKWVTRDDIAHGIERLIGDGDIRRRAAELRTKFEQGFPASSVAALDAFRDFFQQRVVK